MTLKDILRDRGLKQAWVAGKIGIDEARFSDMVRGRKVMPPDKIQLLAELLGVDRGEVLDAAAAAMKTEVT